MSVLRSFSAVALVGAVAAFGAAGAAARHVPTVSQGVPVCTSLSTRSIASALGSFPLRLEYRIAGECDYAGGHTNRYDDAVGITPSVGIPSVYQAAQQAASRSWKGYESQLVTRGYPWSKGFFASATVTGKGPCPLHHVMPTGGPQCVSDPAEVKFEVVVLGHYRPTGSAMMLAITEVAQQGDAHLSHVVFLAKQIMLGTI